MPEPSGQPSGGHLRPPGSRRHEGTGRFGRPPDGVVGEPPVEHTDVLVVGAGPTGLLAALVLARRGVRAVLVDGKAGPTRESRALAVQARTVEVYDQLGLAEEFLARAHRAARVQIGPPGRPVVIDLAAAQRGQTPFPGLHVLEQSRTEELLVGALRAAGGDVRWNHALLDLDDRTAEPGGRVEALLSGDGAVSRLHARWCVGADGAGSLVRRSLGLAFEGVTDDAVFWVADLRGATGLPEDCLAMRAGGRGFGVFYPLGPGGHARVISIAAGPDVGPAEALATAHDDLGVGHESVDWFSTYRVHHRVAERFRHGAVFLAGDAAHVHSPVGGQGMNTGLQDAQDLAHLLADVVHGHVTHDALDRYERERRRVALRLVRVTDRAFGLLARPSRGTALLRRGFATAAAPLAARGVRNPVGRRVAGYVGQYRIRHHVASAPLPVWADDRVVGRRLLPTEENRPSLRSLAWQLHSYGTQPARPADLPDWIEGPHAFPADPAGRWRADRTYLVRPDGFVAAAIPTSGGFLDEAVLHTAFRAHHLRV
ncbi:FAD-dependent monooxygenase [Kineococcus sp. LSe6-4]|uniref:FAD-dependent monooxygenase n=1 Tax=Kineococcus halophytocola TaxID=3234027 RepID=A0ABV4GV44_9ACTN